MNARQSAELALILASHSAQILTEARTANQSATRSEALPLSQYFARTQHLVQEIDQRLTRLPFDNSAGFLSLARQAMLLDVLPRITLALLGCLPGQGISFGSVGLRDDEVRDHRLRVHIRDGLSQLESLRHTTLERLLAGLGASWPGAAELNGLRRRLERWTDVLLAQMPAEIDLKRFAYDARRVRDVAGELRDGLRAHSMSSPLALLSWAHDFPASLPAVEQYSADALTDAVSDGSPDDSNPFASIVQGTLELFPSLESLWLRDAVTSGRAELSEEPHSRSARSEVPTPRSRAGMTFRRFRRIPPAG